MSKEDGLPQHLCQDCARLLQLLYNFRKQAFQTEKQYRKLLESRPEAEVKEENNEFEFKHENDYYDSYSDYVPDTDEIPKQEADEKGYESNEKNFQCNLCHKEYKKENKLLKHLATHEKSNVICGFCGKSFKSQHWLKKHLAKQCKNYNKCNICKETFNSEPLLLEHMKIHSDVEVKVEDEEKFQCSECGRVFSKSRSLAMHLKKHKNKEIHDVYKCDNCQKEFRTKSLLRRHINLHASVKRYSCSKCSKMYSRADQLQAHLKTHDSVKLYICKDCGKGKSFIILCNMIWAIALLLTTKTNNLYK